MAVGGIVNMVMKALRQGPNIPACPSLPIGQTKGMKLIRTFLRMALLMAIAAFLFAALLAAQFWWEMKHFVFD